MEHYDVIIVGTGAGGGTLAAHLAPSGKRILLLERGDWLPREPQNWATREVFVENRYVSPDTWLDGDGTPFQPQVHYFVGGATKLYGAALYRLRKEDFGELQHHDGSSPAWPISYDELEPLLHAGRADVPGARGAGRRPDRAARERALSVPGRLARAAHPAARRPARRRRLPAVPRALRDHARRGQHALQLVHPLLDLRRLPVPRACQVRRGGAGCASGARAPERHAAHEREGRQAGDERRGHGRERGRRRARRRRGALRRRRRRRRLRCGQLGQAAAPVGERQAPGRPRQRFRPGRAQLHVPRQPGRARALARGERDRLPEDARAQRLLSRRRRVRLPTRQHSDGGQVAGRDVPGRETRGDAGSPRSGRSSGSPTTRSTSGSRPRTCRGPRTGSPWPATATCASRYTPSNDGAEAAALRRSSSRSSASST